MTEGQFDSVRAIEWLDGTVKLLDQRLLPQHYEHKICRNVAEVAHAITAMVVRGAPAIGVTAAYGVVLAGLQRYQDSAATWKQDIEQDLALLAASRPTAVNLFWALEHMRRFLDDLAGDPGPSLLAEAQRIHQQDIAANRRMGELGAALIDKHGAVLTHCNTGSLATGGYGTALGVIRAAYAAGKISEVFADETRPWLQGSRLTAWELGQDRIPVTLLADAASAHLMKTRQIRWVIVGADRIAANGDVANKIGTYNAAVVARYHQVRFMVVAPTSTIDMNIASGDDIPIEARSEQELLEFSGQRIAAENARAWNPVFDVTPARLVDAIVTERGVVLAPTPEKMTALMQQ